MTMRAIPVDLGQLSGFTCALPPEPIVDRVTGEACTDRETGLPLYQVAINVRLIGTREAYALTVQVPGVPTGLIENERVRVHDLTAVPWVRDGRSGITYRASAITRADTPAPAAHAAATAATASNPRRTRAGRPRQDRGERHSVLRWHDRKPCRHCHVLDILGD